MATRIPAGVYSETKVQKIGTMGTSRTQTIVDYYKCSQVDDATMSIQILDMYGEPMPLVEKVPVEEFLKRFTFEPEKFQHKATPNELATEKAIARAEHHVARKEYNSAEFEFNKALKLDEENVRANFGLGKLYVTTGEVQKAAKIFSNLAKQDNVLEPENKHFFNGLGMELRELELYDEAIEFYEKARTLADDDENLVFNIARAYYEKGDTAMAEALLEKALAMNPGLEMAQKLKETIDEQK